MTQLGSPFLLLASLAFLIFSTASADQEIPKSIVSDKTQVIEKRADDADKSKRPFDTMGSGFIGKRPFDTMGSGFIGKRPFDTMGSGFIGKRPFDTMGSGFIEKKSAEKE